MQAPRLNRAIHNPESEIRDELRAKPALCPLWFLVMLSDTFRVYVRIARDMFGPGGSTVPAPVARGPGNWRVGLGRVIPAFLRG